MQTILPAVPHCPMVDRHEHTSTNALSWFFHFWEQAPEPVYRPCGFSLLPARISESRQPTAPVCDLRRQPNLPMWSDPTRCPRVRRSPIDDTTAGDRHIFQPECGPTNLAQLVRDRSDDRELVPAR